MSIQAMVYDVNECLNPSEIQSKRHVVLFKMLVSYKIIVLNFIYTEISEPPPLVTPDVFDGWPLTEVRLGPIVYSLADSLTKLIEL